MDVTTRFYTFRSPLIHVGVKTQVYFRRKPHVHTCLPRKPREQSITKKAEWKGNCTSNMVQRTQAAEPTVICTEAQIIVGGKARFGPKVKSVVGWEKMSGSIPKNRFKRYRAWNKLRRSDNLPVIGYRNMRISTMVTHPHLKSTSSRRFTIEIISGIRNVDPCDDIRWSG